MSSTGFISCVIHGCHGAPLWVSKSPLFKSLVLSCSDHHFVHTTVRFAWRKLDDFEWFGVSDWYVPPDFVTQASDVRLRLHFMLLRFQPKFTEEVHQALLRLQHLLSAYAALEK